MAEKTIYHIYLNGAPVYVNLDEDEFTKEYSYLKGFDSHGKGVYRTGKDTA